MKQTVGFSEFCDAFVRMGRNESFTYKGKRALFDWYEEYEESTGEETELDVVAICCDWSEHASALDALSDLGAGMYDSLKADCPDDDPSALEEAALKYLHECATVVEFQGGILVMGF